MKDVADLTSSLIRRSAASAIERRRRFRPKLRRRERDAAQRGEQRKEPDHAHTHLLLKA
jgi:hypothetical protein